MREALYATPSAQHGTDATHKMQHTTIRPVPQHAPNTNGTDNTQQAMQCTIDETNEIRTLAHLGARCAGGGGVGWSVGLGLPESDVTVESCNSQTGQFGYTMVRPNRLREVQTRKWMQGGEGLKR